MSKYDTWLVAPYEKEQEELDQFMVWAEEEGYDLTIPHQFKEADRAYEKYLYDRAEDAAEDAYERAMEARYEALNEREFNSW